MIDYFMSTSNVIGVIFIVIMFVLAFRDLQSFHSKYHKSYQGVIISLGVLGTFIGIFVGIYDFDTKNIQGSVPLLLDGLKLAFITSIVGMSISIALTIYQTLQRMGERTEDLSLEDNLVVAFKKLSFLEYLEQLPELNKKLSILEEMDEKLIGVMALPEIEEKLGALENINDKLEVLSKVEQKLSILEEMDEKLIGLMALPEIEENISSMSSDVKNLRTDLEDKNQEMINFLKLSLDEINNSLKETIEHLSKGATQEIMDALTSVIANFNDQLQEQFGDNFKQLNQAVIKMIDWQEHYKDTIEHTQKTLDSAVKSIDISSSTIDEMSKKYEKIVDVSGQLERVLIVNEEQIKNIKEHLKAFHDMGSKTEESSKALGEFSKVLQETLTSQTKDIQKLMHTSNNFFEEVGKQLPDTLEGLEISLTKLTDKFRDDYEIFLQHVKKIIEFGNEL